MKLQRFVAAIAGAGVLAVSGAALASAESSSTPTDVYAVAAEAPSVDGGEIEPRAVPAAFAVATVAARGFTAARAPQQVAQVARAAGWLSGLGLIGVAQVQSAQQLALEKTYFDR
ncbi:hypothetical protein BCF74_13320 [Knoellia remsis]|uniref:Uncharacterized protein n=1 Tax=Knoellia remsis TaxID=407159 RepID=A0A2T0U3L4_9MICO|nr:hypothetical protein [Knoellia remsis]PRY52491.1 hypothetical protein BCF74_13320 [Knoellia remsis]